VRSADLGDGGDLVRGHAFALRLWFEALWHVTSQKSGGSAPGLQRVLGLGSYRTAWNLLHKLRRAMVRPGRERLQGTVEVDEIFIGGPRPGKRGRGAQGKVLVVVAAQQAEVGSKVRTDDWRGYSGLDRLGYQHQIIRSSAEVGENLLPLANRVASLLKKAASWSAPARLEMPDKASPSRCPPTATPPSWAGLATTRSIAAAGLSGPSRATSWSAPARLRRPDKAPPSRCPPTALPPSWAGLTTTRSPGRSGLGPFCQSWSRGEQAEPDEHQRKRDDEDEIEPCGSV
jgi:hypothetical protein